MALYHFYWQGKLRTVSVNKVNKTRLSLQFVDDEILQKVTSSLLIDTSNNTIKYVNPDIIKSIEEAESLLSSIERSIGTPIMAW